MFNRYDRSALAPVCAMLAMVACGGQGVSNSDEVSEHSPDVEVAADQQQTSASVDVDLSKATPMEVVAEAESETQQVQFVAISDPNADRPSVEVAMAIQTQTGARDDIAALTEDGATPLEVYLYLTGNNAHIPEVLLQHHAQKTALDGRDADVRDYSALPLVSDYMRTSLPEACSSLESFLDLVEINTSGLVSSSGLALHSVSKASTSASNKDVLIFMCNQTSTQTCIRDRKRALVFVTFPMGGAGVLDITMRDCDYLRFEFSQRNDDYTYGITARDGCVVDGQDCEPSDRVRSYLAVGWQL